MLESEICQRLGAMCRQAEKEAGVSLLEIDTSLGLAVFDVLDALGLTVMAHLVLGNAAFVLWTDEQFDKACIEGGFSD